MCLYFDTPSFGEHWFYPLPSSPNSSVMLLGNMLFGDFERSINAIKG